jgi:hypothetical protein
MAESKSNLKLLIKELTSRPDESGETYQQTSVLPLASYYQLVALGEHLRIPRNRLSGKLLAAAIADAINELPDDEEYSHDGNYFTSAARYIEFMAWDFEQADKRSDRYLARLKAKGALVDESGSEQP